MSQTTIKPILPILIEVGGIPLHVRRMDAELNAANLISKSNIDNQTISVLSTLPARRQHRTVCGEIAWQLMYAAGFDADTCDDLQAVVGNSLHNLLKDNDFTWIKDEDMAVPNCIIINGMMYIVRWDCNEYLDAKRLSGECSYDDAEIKLDKTLTADAVRVIACHEIIHGLLYESGYNNMNDESKVRPLGFFLYLFLRDNDFSFIRGC